VVKCDARVVKEHMLSPATSDIVNVLSHKAVARHVVATEALVQHCMLGRAGAGRLTLRARSRLTA
jgi:hypothetical protein